MKLVCESEENKSLTSHFLPLQFVLSVLKFTYPTLFQGWVAKGYFLVNMGPNLTHVAADKGSDH